MIRIEKQHLIFKHVEADLLRRFAELESLRKQVRLGEAAKRLSKPSGQLSDLLPEAPASRAAAAFCPRGRERRLTA